MGDVFKADLWDMQRWAEGIIASLPHDFNIGDNYLRRWWILPRNDYCNVYLHEILKSDIDRAMHDHPWASTSFIISGGYIEHTPEGTFERQAGDVVSRAANALHRLEVPEGSGGAVSLFMTGSKVREWGFDCEHGWVHWMDFTHPGDSSRVGRGCGEHDDLTPITENGKLRRSDIIEEMA